MVPMPPTNKTPHEVHGFTVLPLHCPPQRSFPTATTHHLYFRANAPKVPTDDTPREIFLVNVPVDATELHIRALFANSLGGTRVERVDFEGARVGKGITAPVVPTVRHKGQGRKRKRRQDDGEGQGQEEQEVGLLPETWERYLHGSGGTAVVTMVDRASADLAVKEARKAAKTGRKIVWGEGVEGKVSALGSARYLAHQKMRYPDPAVLQQSVDAFMEAFAAKERALAVSATRQRTVVDEDGFTTVTRGGRTGPAREEEAKAKEEELKKREKNRVREDFYRFQVREKRKEQAQDLVRGFEDDVRKVEEMKRKRGGFRPER